METKCWLETEHKQCCCVCRHHYADHYHCAVHQELRGTSLPMEGCICRIQKGWICAGFLATAGGDRVHSDWPEHSIGCEMFDRRPA